MKQRLVELCTQQTRVEEAAQDDEPERLKAGAADRRVGARWCPARSQRIAASLRRHLSRPSTAIPAARPSPRTPALRARRASGGDRGARWERAPQRCRGHLPLLLGLGRADRSAQERSPDWIVGRRRGLEIQLPGGAAHGGHRTTREKGRAFLQRGPKAAPARPREGPAGRDGIDGMTTASRLVYSPLPHHEEMASEARPPT